MRRYLNLNLIIGGTLTVLVIVGGIFAPWLTHFDPVLDADLMSSEMPPDGTFWFGTDAQGRDIFTRVLYGARISLTVGIVSQLINSVIGMALGISAGYWGGWWDDLVNGLTNMMLAIPSLIFALAIMAVLGPGLTSLLIALGLTNWSWTCRIARSSTLSLKSQGYVQAAQTLGYSDVRIMATQLVPNMLGPILVIGTLGAGSAVLSEAALSFLGLGIRPPFPSWGSMLTDARELIVLAPWAAIFPGLAIFLAVLGFNLLGDGLRDLLDPHMRTRTE
jgi:peptide/nickel transport system permease protein